MKKLFLIILCLANANCSAILVNRGSPLALEECPTSPWIPLVDTIGAVAIASVVAGYQQKYYNIKDYDEYHQTLTYMVAGTAAMSAVMGYGEIYKCRKKVNLKDEHIHP